MLLTVNEAVPRLVIVSVAVAVVPVRTLPNARLPVTPIVFVAPALIVRLKSCSAVWLAASVTRIRKFAVVATVGVPVMLPLLATSPNPAGRLPDTIDQLYGNVPPLACKVWAG